MDSKIVNRELRREIRPALRALGFESNDRNYWRFTPHVIQVLNFQSFNSYLAEAIGATTYSFSVNLGVFVVGMPLIHKISRRGDRIYPREYHCEFRGRLLKTLEQRELQREDTWFVRPDGSNLLECIGDAKKLIMSKGLSWFKQLSTYEQMLDELDHPKLNAAWGTPDSPIVNLTRAFVLKNLGDQRRSADCLREALKSGALSNSIATIRKTFES